MNKQGLITKKVVGDTHSRNLSVISIGLGHYYICNITLLNSFIGDALGITE